MAGADDEWDPFADPAAEAAACAAAIAAQQPIARDVGEAAVQAAAPSVPAAAQSGVAGGNIPAEDGAIDIDLLQPWEVEQLDANTVAAGEEARRQVRARDPLARGQVALPSVAELDRELSDLAACSSPAFAMDASASRLRPCDALVDAGFAGDAVEVRRLLATGADPNTILLRDERIKGSDGCCSCTITSEEYTPLIAACMTRHMEVVEALLASTATDINVVCQGVNEEMGPYKHFTAADMARLVRDDALVKRLQDLGAKPATQLPEPPWPRPTREGTPAPKARQYMVEPGGGGCAKSEEHAGEHFAKEEVPVARAAPLPAVQQSGGAAVAKATAGLVAEMRQRRLDSPAERARLFRRLILSWHPDKRPLEEVEIATAVCQWLNGPGRCFLEP